MNLRDALVPVLRLGRLFGLNPQPAGLDTSLMIVQIDGQCMALLVDDVMDIFSFSDHSFLPVEDQHGFNGCVAAHLRVGGHTVHLFFPERLLVEQESRCLVEFQAMARQRLRELEEKDEWRSLCRES